MFLPLFISFPLLFFSLLFLSLLLIPFYLHFYSLLFSSFPLSTSFSFLSSPPFFPLHFSSLFQVAVRHMTSPPVSEDEIANAAGNGHYSVLTPVPGLINWIYFLLQILRFYLKDHPRDCLFCLVLSCLVLSCLVSILLLHHLSHQLLFILFILLILFFLYSILDFTFFSS